MRMSELFQNSKRQGEKRDSVGSYLLDKAGYVSLASSGVYNLLPLGLLTIRNIEGIIRKEMNKLGASEVSLPSLQTKKLWRTSGRWDDKAMQEILYVDKDQEYCFAPTHEELMTEIAKSAISSYRDLPVLLYQFQTKFRRELRPRAGLLRGREFIMKDLYSFHQTPEDHAHFYEQVAQAYLRVFSQIGLEAVRTKASGGVFGKEYSDEFQVVTPQGEDEILFDKSENTAYNSELEADLDHKTTAKLERVRAIEVGNIFHLGTKYSEAFGCLYVDKQGKRKPVVMGSYGIGVTRLLGTLAEIYNDEHGLVLPQSVAPYHVYLADLKDDATGRDLAEKLERSGLKVLHDDRSVPNGEKLIEADLLGLPFRVVISEKTNQTDSVELKVRKTGKVEMISQDTIAQRLTDAIH